eukprot:gnl/Trimastix_PCT/513.p1 GENE.gnl/Trimastix_PCT/513~~gnl/Trimastix_PCT/513.p1  ORF type:complete len:1198 (+),score=474.09 gnl/Trimastix_PCT/513:94-3687(+)
MVHLYSLTLQPPTSIPNLVYGNFSAPKAQEIIISRGRNLELLRPDESGKIQSVVSVDCFGIIRHMIAFRLIGGTKDYLTIGSDSGRISVVEYDATKNQFVSVHLETFGKTGCRRIVPGQYLAADPKGRSIMIGAVEKQKLVYVLNRDASANLTISSPLEAHRSHTVVYSMCGLDVGFNNPLFACLELDHSEADLDPTGQAAIEAEKCLTYYELDLGLNHVVRKASEPVDNRANLIISVPGGTDGPGGLLLCGEDFVAYRAPGKPERSVPLPRRRNYPEERTLLVTCWTLHKQKNLFFFLLQTECGDIFKATLEFEEDDVTELRLRYFDTIPVASAMCVLRTGFLFAASEFGPHALYQFQGLADGDDEFEITSATAGDARVYFDPHPLTNLLATDHMDSLAPILDMKIADFAHDNTYQMLSLCGRGARSSLKCLRHGMSVMEMAVTELPGNPNAVWTVRTHAHDALDRYIVVSFVNATLVLSIGETVEEVTDSGFLATAPTLSVSLLGEDALLQVHTNGIRHIRADRRINEWKTPGRKQILRAAVNERQVVVCLQGGELIYFELDVSGQLVEIDKKDLGAEVACLEIGPVPPGRQRSRFLAIGGFDNTVRVLSLDPEDCLQMLSLQALQSQPESLCILEMRWSELQTPQLFLNIGLQNGVLLRTVLDPPTGKLRDTRQRFLGTRPVRLFKISVQGQRAMLALSSRAWLCYMYHARYMTTPLAYDLLEYASGFASEHCPEGIVAITANTLRIISVERLGEVFSQQTVPLRYTPRRFMVHPPTGRLLVVETDNGVLSDREKLDRKQRLAEAGAPDAELVCAAYDLPEADFGPVRAEHAPHWASCLRMMDLHSPESDAGDPSKTVDLVEFPPNEAAFSIGCVRFANHPEDFIVVGTAKDLSFFPRNSAGGYIHLYRIVTSDAGRHKFELVHSTEVDAIPYAFAPFKGRLLVGMGSTLRIYDFGRRRLLRKCENKNFPNFIVALTIQNDRIFVADMTESFHIVRYNRELNQLQIFADDTVPRWLTAWCPLDYDTMVGGDKFGNVFIARLPYDIQEIEDDPTGWNRNLLNGAPYKMTEITQFYIGETVTSLNKTCLMPGGAECIVYGTVAGSVGALYPFISREEVDFFAHLEMAMRGGCPSVLGRDHLRFRSSFFPVKDVIDGDLCERFMDLEDAEQKRIATELDRQPSEIVKKLEDVRNRIL